MSNQDFLKDEETVPVSTRACDRLLAVLGLLGVNPATVVNPVDAAAFILEGIAEAVGRLNLPKMEPGSAFRELVRGTVEDSQDVLEGLAAAGECPPGAVVEIKEEGLAVPCPPHLQHQLGHCGPGCEFCRTRDAIVELMRTDEGFQKVVGILAGEPTNFELEQSDTETHAGGCPVWDDGDCECFQDVREHMRALENE